MGNSNSYTKHNDMMNYIEDRLDNLVEKVSNNSNILRQMNNDILEMKKKILNNQNIFEKFLKQDNLQITDNIIDTIISESDTWLPDDTEKILLKNSVQVVLQILQKKIKLKS
tara:strand:+ start:460 stop:795 length:336 start_codon:yes stop_codon:yes gene_type:complete